MKQSWKPGTTIYPLPAVLVSCGNTPEEYNLITVSWVGTLCTNPPMCYISVRPERYSYEILRKNMEFVINLTTVQMAKVIGAAFPPERIITNSKKQDSLRKPLKS